MLEGKHVIGLFLLMLLFSGVFFTLGYVMGRNQYDGQVRAATTSSRTPDTIVSTKNNAGSKKSSAVEPPEHESDPATASNKSDWEFYNNNTPAKREPRLDAAPKPSNSAPAAKSLNAKARVEPPPPAPVAAPVPVTVRTGKPVTAAPSSSAGAMLLQVAAVSKQDDALSIAGSLQKKRFPATVLAPQKDKFYRVQVGPYKDQKSAEAAKKGLEDAGFKAFYVKH
ncbi:MAG TPA: SPOR domain-containing protein [Candidatus Acidoferrum sp.]